MKFTFSRWLPAITETPVVRKSSLAVAGLAFAGIAVAGPATNAVMTEAARTPDATGPAATAVTTATSPDKPTGKTPVDVLPHGVPAGQESIPLSPEQEANAKAIVKATKDAGLDERAAVVAVATSLQESKLENLGHLGASNDHDSQGLFQQRPSSGWGSVDQITDPEYATHAFLKGLRQVDGWRDLPLTEAAQKVQVSAYPDAYAKWEKQAADIVAGYWH